MKKQKEKTDNNSPPPRSAKALREGESGGGGAFGFLFKPIFFICSLLFATWLVLYIEKINPSDLGKYESFFKSKPKQHPREPFIHDTLAYDKRILEKICKDYKAGLLDSANLDKQLKFFLESPEGSARKQKGYLSH